MKLVPPALAKAREITGNPGLERWFVKTDNWFVLGFVTEPDAEGLVITNLLSTVRVTVNTQVTADPSLPGLHWLLAHQDMGAVLYQWTEPDGTRHDFVLEGRPRTTTGAPEAGTTKRLAELQDIWRIMFTTKMPYRTVRPAVEGAGVQHAAEAINMAGWLLQKCGLDKARFRAYAEELWQLTHGRFARLRLELQGNTAVGFDNEKLTLIMLGVRYIVQAMR